MPTFKFKGPENAARVPLPNGKGTLVYKKGVPFETEDPYLVSLLKELPCFDEVVEKPSKK